MVAAWTTLSLGLALGLLAAPCRAADEGELLAGLHLDLAQQTLPNGLRIVVAPDHRAPMIALHLQAAAGAGDDVAPPGGGPPRPGLAHLVEHLLYAGSPGVPAGAYDGLLAAAGGDNNAWTSHESMAVHLVAPVEALDLALYLEADRLARLRRADVEERLPVERSIVDREAAVERDSPGGRDRAALRAALYPPTHPDGHGVLGDPLALQQVTVDEVLAFQQGAWAPSDTVLVLVGDVEVDAALDRIEHYLGAVPARPGPLRPLPAPPPAAPGTRAWHQDEVEATTLYAAWPVPPQDHPDSPALALLAELLGGEGVGRLEDRVERGRLDRAEAWVDQGRRGGHLVVRLSHRRRSARALLAELQRQLRDLERAPPDSVELDELRARWRSWAARALEDPQDRAEILATCLQERGQADCFADHVQRHLAVEPAELQRVARTWLAPEPVLLSVTSRSHRGRALSGSTPLELP